MTDQNPQVVAAASLSPVSPRPLHTTYSLPKVLPDLQQQAENPDVVPLEQTTYRTAEAAMAEPDTIAPTESAQVAAAPEGSVSSSDLASIADDDSFQYDGEGDGDNGQAEAQDATEQEAQQDAGDDYAMIFDSPAEKEQQDGQDGQEENQEQQEQQQQPQEVVSDAPEFKSIPDQHVHPDPVDPQASSPSENGSPSDQPISTDSSSQSSENGHAAVPVQEAAMPDATADASAAEPAHTEQPAQPDVVPDTARAETIDVQPKPEDVEMTTGDTSDATPLDIQKLVDQITAKSEATEQATNQQATQATQATSLPSASTADVDFSLPAKPALTQEQSKQTFSPATYHHASLPNAPTFAASKPTSLPAQPSQSAFANNSAGVQGIAQSLSFQAAAPNFPSFPNAYPPGNSQQPPTFQGNSNGPQQSYDDFLADERKAMADAKWERFPDGSRIFIGNLSQERVSKRDVFELFHPHGRLAQISLKSAYGFVQYHTTAEAQSAIDGLQGAEVKGRKINLEISRTQKTKKDREHTPPERRNRGDRGERGDRGGRNGDRYDGGRRRDNDFRGPRSPSPRREDSHRGRQDSYNRDRGSHNGSNRKRSRSPQSHRRTDSYRRRSPSPYGRGRQEQANDQLGIPRRYGNDVPDVQILMMQDVHKDFVDWVQRSFHEQGLRPDAMFLNPRFPREAVIQRQVLEGVHGVVELDMRAQNTGKISLQVFDRSAGSNVRFDQYQELDPTVAAQLVLRTKASAVAQQQQQAPTYPSYAPQPYGAPNPYGGYGQPAMQQPQQPQATSDITALVSQLSQMPNIDAGTMQTILASLQPQQPAAPVVPPTPVNNYPAYPQAAAPQVDLTALINNLSAASANNGPAAMRGGGAMTSGRYAHPGGYPQQQPQQQQMPAQPQTVAGSSDPARDVQDIIATFARYRQ